ncbi:MAG: winged helix DNA-binding domain-containing protein [Rhodoglobus sp.]
MTIEVTWAEAVARRLERHGLGTPFADVAAAASAVCGVHAQVMSAAEVSLGLRVAGATAADVQSAIGSGELVKTYGPRGTVHLLTAADLPMWVGALSELPFHSGFAEGVRLSPEQTDAVVAAIADAVAGHPLTIDELDTEVARRAGSWAADPVMPAFNTLWPRWRQAITTAANRGAVAFGPNRGRNVTYAAPPAFEPLAADAALDALLRAYLHAYGPATPAQFAQWLAAPRAFVEPLFAAMDQVTLAGVPAWVAPGDTVFAAPAPPAVLLLPYFDAYVVGSQPRELLFPGPMFERALGRGQAGVFPVVLVDGVVAGIWHSRRAGKRLSITVEGTAPREAVRIEADRIGAILGMAPAVTFGPITVGPHA